MLVEHAGARHLQNQQPPPSGGNNTDGTIAIVVIVTAVFFIIWSPTLVRRCRNRRNGLNYGLDASGQRLSEAYLEAVVMRRLSELNRSRTDHPHRMSERDRRDFIANVLFTRRIVLDPTVKADVVSPSEGTRQGKLDVTSYHLSAPSKHGQLDDCENCCAICLNEYKDDDEVCLSNNRYCNHFFHRACITEWLVTHEECPCCRHFFLFFVENERDLVLFEGRREGERHERVPPVRPTSPAISDLPDVEVQPDIPSLVASPERQSSQNDQTNTNLSDPSHPGAAIPFATPDTADPHPRPQRPNDVSSSVVTRSRALSEAPPTLTDGSMSSALVPSAILQRGLQVFDRLRNNLTSTQGNQTETPPGSARERPRIQEIEA